MVKQQRVTATVLVILSLASNSGSAVEVTIWTDRPLWTISEHLLGLHTRYDVEEDAAYQDGSVARWAASSGVATMRYPGGSTTKTYHWQDPSGDITIDPWDPGYTGPVAPPEKWMDLAEYLQFVALSGIEPLIGINHLSGTLYDRTQDSIDRAAACVQHVKDSGYPGAYYYIGNEDMLAAGGSLEGAARLFVRHARAMKAIDPDIKIFWNDNDITRARLKSYLAIAGDWADGCEFHSKWPYGGVGDESIGYYDEWKTQVPLVDRRRNRTHRKLVANLRTAATEAGYPDLLLANNEYGIGKKTAGFNKYTYGLLIVDFLQEFFISGYHMSCFWNNIRGDSNGLLSRHNGYRKNPMHLGYQLIANAQGATMIASKSSHQFVYGFAASTPCEFLLYLLNKTETDQPVNVRFVGPQPETSAPRAEAMVDTSDHWGTIASLAVHHDEQGGSFSTTLPALSYTRITFGRNLLKAGGTVFAADFDAAAVEENTTGENIEKGTTDGSWSNIPESGSHIRNAATEQGLLVDQVSGGLLIYGIFNHPLALEETTISFRTGIRRTLANHTKDITITGLDALNNRSFELVLTAVSNNGPAGERRRIAHVDPAGNLAVIAEGSDNDLPYLDDEFDPAALAQVNLHLLAGGYLVEFSGRTEWQSQLLPYRSQATSVSRLRISGSAAAGVWLDAIRATGRFWTNSTGGCSERQPFLRGDANADGSVDISDAITTLGFLFLGQEGISCLDAADSNDDSAVDISDAVATLGALFLGQGPIPQPGMNDCGLDPTPDEVTCEDYLQCEES